MARRLIPSGPFFVRPVSIVNRRNCAWPVVLETCDVIPGPRRLALGARRPLPSPIPRRPGFYIQSLLYVGPGCCVLCGIGAASCPVSPARCRLPGVACPGARIHGPGVPFPAPWPKVPRPRSSLRNGGKLPKTPENRPPGPMAAAPASFRTNNPRKNDIA